MSEFVISLEQCKQSIQPDHVCEDCGGQIDPIETVDNAGSPTHWQGCLHCCRFTPGVPEWIRNIAVEMNGDYESYGRLSTLCYTLSRFHYLSSQPDELTTLRAENERLRKALERITDAADSYLADQSTAHDPRCGNVQPITVEEGLELIAAYQQARAALEGK